jgi:uncharacterized protein
MSYPACPGTNWRLRLLRAVATVITALGMATATPVQISSTNLAPQWLPLAELLKKWEGSSLQDVRQAADKGDAYAEHYLGYCYTEGFRVAQNPEAGVAWYERAMQKGYLPSVNNLGLVYQRGLLGSNDMGKAVYFYRYAADRGLPTAQVNLGQLYREGAGVDRDPVEAMKWFRLAADQNWAAGQYQLGLIYLEGNLIEQDEERGLELTRAAADQGLNDALHELADLYARGVGEPRSGEDRPLRLLERARVHSEVIFRYEYGLGTERDLVAAARWHCRAALAGAYISLADEIEFRPTKQPMGSPIVGPADGHVLIYRPYGSGYPSEGLLRVVSLYLKSSMGDGPSALQIGERYWAGQDVPQSMSNAWLWFTLAAQHGNSGAPARIAQTERRMTESELKQANQQLSGVIQELNTVAATLRETAGFQNSKPSGDTP